MEKIHWITYLLLLFLNKMGFAQVELRTIVPLSPNSAEMTKYIDAPVDYFTGVPAINIPLFNIEDGGLDLPLQLSYHAGGNKVESIATWIGLAWSLNPIPSITRSVNGLPDEGPGGFFTVRYYDPKNGTINAVLRGGFASGKDLLIGTNAITGRVTTVVRGSNLVKSRFVSIQ